MNTNSKIYADFLASYGTNYEQVLVCDTRDVICQDDVFEQFNGYSNYLGYTTERQLIGEDRAYNYPWIEKRFGKAEADKLADKEVICAGTVIGTVNEMKIFCHEIWEFIKHALTNK